MLTEERFYEIMEEEFPYNRSDKDTILEGLNIMSKYIDGDMNVIAGAEHDQIYGPDIGDLIEGGIPEDEVRKLNTFGFFIDDDYLSHYV